MAFKKVGLGSFKYVKYSECEAGQVLAEGTYLGSREDQFGKPAHMIKAGDGSIQILNSSGHLNYQLANLVQVGDYIRVTYAGTTLLEGEKYKKYKNKESHQFEVEVDSDRHTQGVKTPDLANTAEDDEDVETDTEEDEEEDTREIQYKTLKTTSKTKVDKSEEVPQTSSKPSSEDILNRYRRKA